MGTQEDHNYVYTRRSRRINPLRILENTDHDYLATSEGTIEHENDNEVEAELQYENAYENVAPRGEQNQEIEIIDLVDAHDNNDGGHNTPPTGVSPGLEIVEPSTSAEAAASAAAATAAAASTHATTPLPPKKRMRVSKSASKSTTPKMKSPSTNSDDEDSGMICPICLDTWEMSGEHRLVSLRCGHLFGESCIRRWLLESSHQSGIKACPQCKTKASNKDIRCLYAKRLRAIDRSEEHRLREQLDDERRRMQGLQTELATVKMSYSFAINKIQNLESDNERMKLILRNGGGNGGYGYDTDIAKLTLHTYKLFLERNIEISREPGCRVMVHAENHSAIIASQKSSQSLFPGYGLIFMDVPTFRPLHFLHTSAKLLRDITLSADQQMLTAASMEPRVKMFDLRSRQVSGLFKPSERAIWSCAMDRNERDNFLYLGSQHGSTYVYDLRFPENVVDEFKTEGDMSPVINVAPVPAGKHFPNGGFIICKLQSLWFHEYSSASGSVVSTRLSVEGHFISMNFDVIRETLLVSARNSSRYPHSRYLYGKLEKIGGMPVFNIAVSFNGSMKTPVMTRSAQIAVEENTLIASYIQDVKYLSVFDCRREARVQSLPVQEVVYDVCPLYLPDTTLVATLTETKCRLFKINRTS